MNVLPKFTQPFLTWLTSVPTQEQLQKWNGEFPAPIYHVGMSYLKLLTGVAFSAAAYFHSRLGISASLACAMYLAGFILSTSAFRKLQVVIYHNCAHHMVFASKLSNRMLGTFIAVTCLLKNFDQYQIAHRNHHHSKKLLTTLDDTLNFITDQLGIKPSDSPRSMWKKLILSVLSPVYHARQFMGRVSTCCFVSDTWVSAGAIIYWTVLVVLVTKFSLILPFIAIWMLPLVIGYQISLALRLCAEHCWPDMETLQGRGSDFVALSTTSVFMGEPLVLSGSPLRKTIALARWAMKILTVHLFFRLFVMVGDTPCHDFHHRRPSDKEWTNYPLARARDKVAGCIGYSSNYIDSWGLISTISANFYSFSKSVNYYKGLYQ